MVVGDTFRVGEVVAFQRGSWKAGVWGLAPEAAGRCAEFPHGALSSMKGGVLLASGEGFVASNSARERIQVETGAVAVDMNSFGFLRACIRFQREPVIFRVVSDNADDRAAEDFREFVAAYEGDLGLKLREAILLMEPSPENPDAHPAIRELLGQ